MILWESPYSSLDLIGVVAYTELTAQRKVTPDPGFHAPRQKTSKRSAHGEGADQTCQISRSNMPELHRWFNKLVSSELYMRDLVVGVSGGGGGDGGDDGDDGGDGGV